MGLLGLHAAAREDDGSTPTQAVFGSQLILTGQFLDSPELPSKIFLEQFSKTLSAPTLMHHPRSPGSGAARPPPSASGIFPHQGPWRPAGYTLHHSNQQNRAGNRFPQSHRQGFLHAPPPFSTTPLLGPPATAERRPD